MLSYSGLGLGLYILDNKANKFTLGCVSMRNIVHQYRRRSIFRDVVQSNIELHLQPFLLGVCDLTEHKTTRWDATAPTQQLSPISMKTPPTAQKSYCHHSSPPAHCRHQAARVCSCCYFSPLGGCPNVTHWNKEEGMGSCPYVMAICL